MILVRYVCDIDIGALDLEIWTGWTVVVVVCRGGKREEGGTGKKRQMY